MFEIPGCLPWYAVSTELNNSKVYFSNCSFLQFPLKAFPCGTLYPGFQTCLKSLIQKEYYNQGYQDKLEETHEAHCVYSLRTGEKSVFFFFCKL